MAPPSLFCSDEGSSGLRSADHLRGRQVWVQRRGTALGGAVSRGVLGSAEGNHLPPKKRDVSADPSLLAPPVRSTAGLATSSDVEGKLACDFPRYLQIDHQFPGRS